MLINSYNTAYKMAAYPIIGYSYLLGFSTGAALTSFALNKIYQNKSPNSYPNNYLSFNLKISAIVGLSTGLLASCVAAKILLKN